MPLLTHQQVFFFDARWLPDACPHVAPGTEQGLGFNFRQTELPEIIGTRYTPPSRGQWSTKSTCSCIRNCPKALLNRDFLSSEPAV